MAPLERLALLAAFVAPAARCVLAAPGGVRGLWRARASLVRSAPRAGGTPMVPFKVPNSEFFQWVGVYDRMARERILFVSRPLDDSTTNSLIATLLFLENEDRKKPVDLYMNVPGALTKSGFALYDTMRTMAYPIGTVNLGLCAHMGAFLCAAGSKGRRSTLPNSRYVLCSPAMVMAAGAETPIMQAEDLSREVREVMRDRERLVGAYAQLCGQPAEVVRRVLLRDTYFDAEEAKAFGLVDNVLMPKAAKAKARGDSSDFGAFNSKAGTVSVERARSGDGEGRGNGGDAREQPM